VGPILRRAWSILRERCPRCDRGPLLGRELHECGLPFTREPGYFVGAMYFSYGLGVIVIGLFVLAGWLVLPDAWPIERIIIIGWVLFLPLVPATFRWSRVIWLHFDHVFDPPP
jgi:hypothetical protein